MTLIKSNPSLPSWSDPDDHNENDFDDDSDKMLKVGYGNDYTLRLMNLLVRINIFSWASLTQAHPSICFELKKIGAGR